MVKNGSKINIDLVNTVPTEQPNGVEIKIQVPISKGDSIYDSIAALSYVPNLYVNKEGSHIAEKFNKRKITKFKNFNTCNIVKEGLHLLIGNVLYRVNKYKFPILNQKNKEVLDKLAIKFEIGELTVTPNREDILYTDETIAKINQKIEATIQEIEEIFKQQNDKDFTDIIEYWLHIKGYKKILTLGDIEMDIRNTWLIDLVHATYKGKDLVKESPGLVNGMCNCFQSRLNKFNCITASVPYRSNELCTNKMLERYTFIEAITNKRYWYNDAKKVNTSIYILPSSKGTKSQYFKDYILENYVRPSSNGSVIFLEKLNLRNKTEIHKFLKEDFLVSDNKKECIWFYKELIRALRPYTTVIDIVNSPDFIQYKKDNKVTNESLKSKVELPFYTTRKSEYSVTSYTLYFKTAQEANERLKLRYENSTFIVLYGVKGNPYTKIFNEFRMWNNKKNTNTVIIEVAKTNWKYMINLPVNWIPIEKVVTYNCKEIISYATLLNPELHSIYKLKSNNSYLWRKVSDLSYFLPKQEKKLIKYASSIDEAYIGVAGINEIIDEWVTTITSKGLEDTDLKNGLLLIKKYSEIVEIMEPILKITGEISFLFAYFGLKNKLFRLDNTVYQYLRDKLKLKIK